MEDRLALFTPVLVLSSVAALLPLGVAVRFPVAGIEVEFVILIRVVVVDVVLSFELIVEFSRPSVVDRTCVTE